MSLPSATCKECGEWVPCKYPILVVDKKNQLGRGADRWISLETPAQALSRHKKKSCSSRAKSK
jgi:hypothetical protein